MNRDERHLTMGVAILAIAVALVFAPDDFLPMLARAFMRQWTIAFVVLAGVLAWRGWRWPAAASLSGAVLLSLGMEAPREPGRQPAADGCLRLMHLNVFQPNQHHADVLRLVLGSGADVVCVQEVSPQWAGVLARGLRDSFPHQHIEPRTDCYGIALFSRRPLRQVRTRYADGTPFITAELEADGEPLRLIAVHATSPTSIHDLRRRNRQLDAVAHWVRDGLHPTVVIGDLNTVPWDEAFRRFAARSGLSPVSVSERTWPSLGPLALIPLDHVLLSPHLAPVNFRSFHIPGSDHRGIMATIAVHHHAT